MQNTETLKSLGFLPTPKNNEFIWRGNYQRFIARNNDSNYHPYISLSLIDKNIDNRPYSTRKGLHFRSFIKDCNSEKSVERALIKYDLPDEKLEIGFFGVNVID